MEGCPRTWGLSILARKWSYFVLRALSQPKTFSELSRELKYATNHVLSRELKLLSEEKLIEAKETKYQVTTAGAALLSAVEPLHEWGFKHMKLQPCPPELACSRCTHYSDIMKPKF